MNSTVIDWFDVLSSKRWHTYVFPDLIFKCLILSLQRPQWNLWTAPNIRSLGIGSLNQKELESLVWHSKAISAFQQFKTPLNA